MVANWSFMAMALVPALWVATISFAALLSADPQSLANAARESSRANALVAAGKPEQAIPIYRELAAAFPNEPSFRINLAIALFKAGRYRDTIDECNALLKRQPDLFPAWLFLGASHLKLGNASTAEGPLRKALAIRADDPNAHIMLADVLLAQQRWAEAADQYEISARVLPASPRLWYGLNRSYESLAAQSLQRIEDLAPTSAEALALSAEFELDQGQSQRHFNISGRRSLYNLRCAAFTLRWRESMKPPGTRIGRQMSGRKTLPISFAPNPRSNANSWLAAFEKLLPLKLIRPRPSIGKRMRF